MIRKAFWLGGFFVGIRWCESESINPALKGVNRTKPKPAPLVSHEANNTVSWLVIEPEEIEPESDADRTVDYLLSRIAYFADCVAATVDDLVLRSKQRKYETQRHINIVDKMLDVLREFKCDQKLIKRAESRLLSALDYAREKSGVEYKTSTRNKI